MSAMHPIGKTIRRQVRKTIARDGARVHPSWLGTPPSVGDPADRLDAPTLRRLWDAIDGE